MWIWLRFVSSFDNLRTIQKKFISHFEDWRSRGIIRKVVSTYRGRIKVHGNIPVLANGNLYVCLELLGINEDAINKEIDLSDTEIKQIPLEVSEVINQLTHEFNLSVDYKGEGISDSTYDHLSIRNYKRALELDSYRVHFSSDWNVELILEIVSRGTKIGLKYYEIVLSKNEVNELILIVQDMWKYINSMNDFDANQKMYCFHIAAHTIPKVLIGIRNGKQVVGFIDKLLFN